MTTLLDKPTALENAIITILVSMGLEQVSSLDIQGLVTTALAARFPQLRATPETVARTWRKMKQTDRQLIDTEVVDRIPVKRGKPVYVWKIHRVRVDDTWRPLTGAFNVN